MCYVHVCTALITIADSSMISLCLSSSGVHAGQPVQSGWNHRKCKCTTLAGDKIVGSGGGRV